eukprot:CAMPEP_0197436018 /NCGR_PEP_ID=MMETSP1175-20131217/3499_1 /TAXON_ID=1003142 /ORGANISM="Triceratium dubium, Strain CCMP147" /LENGTH=185 /DNA_ID=CAMNT_0042965191 /DNA_START=105 /DNA_END=662 /DNA_ORIENTATION=-
MTEIIAHPEKNDVLCGRGGATNNHIGNRRYREIVSDHQTEYLHAKKRDKQSIARRIVGIVRSRGGRFLKKTDDGTGRWFDVGEKKAREKTSQALREGLEARRDEAELTGGAQNDAEGEVGQPAKKRRRTNGQANSSPHLVSQLGAVPSVEDFSLPSLSEEDYEIAQFLFEPPPPSAEDATDVVAV